MSTFSVPRVQTERLTLRAFTDGDLDAFAAISADPQVMRHLGGDPMDRAEAWRAMALFAGSWALRGYGQWAVEIRESGQLAGRAGPWCPEGWPGLEIGWTLAREHWGKGYATEAGRASLDFAWDVIGVDRVISLIAPNNPRSARVAQRLGMRLDAEAVIRGDAAQVYAITRPERPPPGASRTAPAPEPGSPTL